MSNDGFPNDNIKKAREKIKKISNNYDKKFNTLERFEDKIFITIKIIYEFDFTAPFLLKDLLEIKSFGFSKKLESRNLIKKSHIDMKTIYNSYPKSILTLTKFGFETYKNLLIEKFNINKLYLDELKYNTNPKIIVKQLNIIDKIIIQKIFITNYNYLLHTTMAQQKYDTHKTFKLKNPKFIRIPDLVFYLKDEIQLIEYIKTIDTHKKEEKILKEYLEILDNGSKNINIYVYCANENIKNHFIELLNNRSYKDKSDLNKAFIQFSEDYYDENMKEIVLKDGKKYNINYKKRLNFTSINQIQYLKAIEQAKWYYASKFIE